MPGTFTFTVGGFAVTQTIPVYSSFIKTSGPEPDRGKQNYLLYLHGFNVNHDQAFEGAGSFFKRLWWAGYRGNFIGLTWEGDEDDPFGHTCDTLPNWMRLPCVAKFFPNMSNALQTSPALLEFVENTVIGSWNANPENINLVAHSLGNLVALDTLRLFAVRNSGTENRLINHMVSVEAAVWEETLWEESDVEYPNLGGSIEIDRLKRGSWAFWFNQSEHSIFDATNRLVSSWVNRDEALDAMKLNDVLPILGRGCGYEGSPDPEPYLCPREDRLWQRGAHSDYRVPTYDGLDVGDHENRPDLSYEIPALLRRTISKPTDIPKKDDITDPLGSQAIVNPLIFPLDATSYGWRETKHSDYLERPLPLIWKWYKKLMERSEGSPTSFPDGIIPAGQE